MTTAPARFLAELGADWVGPKGTMMSDRIAILGHSAVTCLGSDIDSTWARLIAGKSGLRRQPSLANGNHLQVIAGIVEDFGPGTSDVDPAVALFDSVRFTWPWRRPEPRGPTLGWRTWEWTPFGWPWSSGPGSAALDVLEGSGRGADRASRVENRPVSDPQLDSQPGSWSDCAAPAASTDRVSPPQTPAPPVPTPLHSVASS